MKESEKFANRIEELILQIADKDFDSAQQLITFLRGYQVDPLPEDTKKLLADNFHFIMEDLDAMVKNTLIQDLVFMLAAVGVDSLQLRDALAAVIRERHSSYPDPSGLINALGIFDVKLTMQEIYSRWNVFSTLKENSPVWHPSYGLGQITEIDAFSDLVYVKFRNKQHFHLAQSLTSLSIAKQNTTTSTLITETNVKMPPDMAPDEFDSCIANDFTPKLKKPNLTTEALIVPKFMDKKSYEAWRVENGTSKTEKSKKVQERTWRNARGLAELKICLAKVKTVKPKNDDSANLHKIFKAEAVKPLSKFIFGESISILWSFCPNASWLLELIHDLPSDTVPWESPENFIEVTCKLPAKLVPNWLLISDIAKGHPWFIDKVTHLPFRFWPSSKHPLMSSQDFVDALSTSVLEKLKKGQGSADSVIWIWRNRRQEADTVFTNSNLILRVLNKSVKGEYTKAYKELYKLLQEDQNFQKVLMDNGSPQGIKTFVRNIKAASVLSKGEQQSLLVKIIRIYPQAQEYVEQRKKVVATRAIPKKTSVRSHEQRRLELEDIINAKIPKNSAAIAHARSYGDLRENAEFKAAKEEQRLLMARRHELERDLKEIMATDFSDVRVAATVIPGCSVELTIDGNEHETFHILGLWDSHPEKNVLSYDTPLGRLLLGKKVGDKLTTPHNLPAQIKSIQPLPQDIIKEWVALPEVSNVTLS